MHRHGPITLRAIDNDNNKLFEYLVPFSLGITARQVMEQAFVQEQTPSNPDPFLFALEYYGYSDMAGYPGYLGYEIASIKDLPNNAEYYWDLLLNDIAATTGADTTFPNPGSTVTWRYTAIAAGPAPLSKRAAIVKKRHGAPA